MDVITKCVVALHKIYGAEFVNCTQKKAIVNIFGSCL